MPTIKNLDGIPQTLEGEPMKERIGNDEPPVMELLKFRTVYTRSLLFMEPGDNLMADGYTKRWTLAVRLQSAKNECECTVDELKMLKDRVPKAKWVILVGAQAIHNLEEK